VATHKDIAIILSRYQAAFPNYNPSDITLAAEVWTEALGHIPADELKVAALACMVETGRAFAPSVGEVLGAVMRLRAQASGLPSAAEAWEQINKPRDLTRCGGQVAPEMQRLENNRRIYGRDCRLFAAR
jgi:hypothetical protein